ncbi:hypothetical protein QF038_004149 [Pseudarthrobacter sp. W1I19]|uniref:hypothetical protein n=1 Tax=Pseudarthrobacter sp. W1I19 TaxID=3042288 RepID=UPI002785647C|nr:hypothetical protein [Pseudarthrobacter sp. W1I19]MDQ0925641.1 hypothetical protein [Pseudarthrobacter sp. W1I19]
MLRPFVIEVELKIPANLVISPCVTFTFRAQLNRTLDPLSVISINVGKENAELYKTAIMQSKLAEAAAEEAGITAASSGSLTKP